MKDFLKKNKFNILILLLYSTVTFIIMLYHESWRDEAQTWLIAKNLSFIDIFKQMKYEGHPCLWNYIIAPFAKLGFPYITQNIICWLIMNTTVAIILWKTSINKLIKVLIIFSAPFTYYYCIIARNYCLIPLALVLIAVLYKDRSKKPIQYVLSISLLAHTHVLMLGLVGILYTVFFIEELFIHFKTKTKDEKQIVIISLVIAILGLLILFMQLYGSTSANKAINKEEKFDINKLNKITQVLEIITKSITGKDYDNLCYSVILMIIIALVYGMIKFPKETIIFLIGFAFNIFVYIYIYSNFSLQKVSICLLLLIFLRLIQEREDEKKDNYLLEGILIIILVFNIVSGIEAIRKDIKNPYSGSKEAAKFIKENIHESDTIVTSHVPSASALIPYLSSYTFWNPQICEYFTYSTWNEELMSGYTMQDFIENTKEFIKDKENIYFIFCYNWTEERSKNVYRCNKCKRDIQKCRQSTNMG